MQSRRYSFVTPPWTGSAISTQAQSMVESAARRVLMVGEQDVQVTLATIKEVVRRMANLPGQRTLILVSPGFVSIAPEALSWESQIMDLAVRVQCDHQCPGCARAVHGRNGYQ